MGTRGKFVTRWSFGLVVMAGLSIVGVQAQATPVTGSVWAAGADSSIGRLVVDAVSQASGTAPSTSPFAGASASGTASGGDENAPTIGEALVQGAQEGYRPGAGTSDSDPGLIDLGLDPAWVGGSETSNLKALSGSVMAMGLIIAVGALVVGAGVWGAERAGAVKMSSQGLSRMGAAITGAVVLGSLSGLAGFGFTLM